MALIFISGGCGLISVPGLYSGPGHETQLVKDGVPVHLHVAEDLAPVLLQFLEALDNLFAFLAGLSSHISEVAWKPKRSAGSGSEDRSLNRRACRRKKGFCAVSRPSRSAICGVSKTGNTSGTSDFV